MIGMKTPQNDPANVHRDLVTDNNPRRVPSDGWLKFPIIQMPHCEKGKKRNHLRQNGNSVSIPSDSPGCAKYRWQGGELGKEQGFLSVIKRCPE